MCFASPVSSFLLPVPLYSDFWTVVPQTRGMPYLALQTSIELSTISSFESCDLFDVFPLYLLPHILVRERDHDYRHCRTPSPLADLPRDSLSHAFDNRNQIVIKLYLQGFEPATCRRYWSMLNQRRHISAVNHVSSHVSAAVFCDGTRSPAHLTRYFHYNAQPCRDSCNNACIF